MLPHLDSGYAVDQAILSEEDRVVIIRFGHDWDPVRSPLQHRVLRYQRWRRTSLCLQPANARASRGADVVCAALVTSLTLCGTRLAAARVHSFSLLAWQSCMKMDETLYHVADKIKNFAVVYVINPSWSTFLCTCTWKRP